MGTFTLVEPATTRCVGGNASVTRAVSLLTPTRDQGPLLSAIFAAEATLASLGPGSNKYINFVFVVEGEVRGRPQRNTRRAMHATVCNFSHLMQ